METRDEILLGERKFITPRSQLCSILLASSLYLFFLTSSSLFVLLPLARFIVKGEVAGGINMRTREEQHSNIVESRRAAGVTGVNVSYSRSQELSSLAPLLLSGLTLLQIIMFNDANEV